MEGKENGVSYVNITTLGQITFSFTHRLGGGGGGNKVSIILDVVDMC